ncbi:MAG: response regulator [Planctomycetota bacterium]
MAGVQAALDYQPDVALLDIGLPGLNGYEVAKRIRQEPTLQNVVLVALTGYGQDSDRQASRQAGFNHHLVKPALMEQLEQILATVSEQVTDAHGPQISGAACDVLWPASFSIPKA